MFGFMHSGPVLYHISPDRRCAVPFALQHNAPLFLYSSIQIRVEPTKSPQCPSIATRTLLCFTVSDRRSSVSFCAGPLQFVTGRFFASPPRIRSGRRFALPLRLPAFHRFPSLCHCGSPLVCAIPLPSSYLATLRRHRLSVRFSPVPFLCWADLLCALPLLVGAFLFCTISDRFNTKPWRVDSIRFSPVFGPWLFGASPCLAVSQPIPSAQGQSVADAIVAKKSGAFQGGCSFSFALGTPCVSVNARRPISLLCLCVACLLGAQPHHRFQTYHSHNALPIAMLILALPSPGRCQASARPCSAALFRFYAIRSFPIAIVSDRSVTVAYRIESVLCLPLPLLSLSLGPGPCVTVSFQTTPARVHSAQS